MVPRIKRDKMLIKIESLVSVLSRSNQRVRRARDDEQKHCNDDFFNSSASEYYDQVNILGVVYLPFFSSTKVECFLEIRLLTIHEICFSFFFF